MSGVAPARDYKAEVERAIAKFSGKIVYEVGMGLKDCPACGGALPKLQIGEKEFIDCPCVGARRFYHRLQQYKVGGEYLQITRKNIRPSNLSKLPVEKQQKLIDSVKTKLDAGWAFFGDPGTGKTTLSVVLFREALKARIEIEEERAPYVVPASLWRCTARQLCQEFQDHAVGKEPAAALPLHMSGDIRTVTRQKIEKAVAARLRPALFIEEWDKVGLTDFRRETLFDILDAMHTADGQLVLTSNMTWDEFCETFGGTNWRIERHCYIVEIIDGKITVTPPKVAL